MKYNVKKMIEDHSSMVAWHQSMAKSAAEAMQDHIRAAAWHSSQPDLIKGMINDVPLDPEKKVSAVPTSNSGGSPTPSPRAGTSAETVAIDPTTMKKSDLAETLKGYAEEYGDFDLEIGSIVNFLINE